MLRGIDLNGEAREVVMFWPEDEMSVHLSAAETLQISDCTADASAGSWISAPDTRLTGFPAKNQKIHSITIMPKVFLITTKI
jgi:hypothetical protein